MRKEKEQLPLLPLRGLLVFPNMVLHLDVGRERSVKALEEAMVGDNRILLMAQKDAKVDEPAEADLFTVGTVALIKQMIKTTWRDDSRSGRRVNPRLDYPLSAYGAVF